MRALPPANRTYPLAGLAGACRRRALNGGVVGHDHYPVAVNREETAVDGEGHPLAGNRLDGQLSGSQDGEHRGVARQDTNLAVGGARLHQVCCTGPHEVVRRNNLNLQFSRILSHWPYFPVCSWILAQLRSTSSRPPILKKACSAIWSSSP